MSAQSKPCKTDVQQDLTKCATIAESVHHLEDLSMPSTNKEQLPLARQLKSRHMQMIAISGSIGAGLFVSSGGALRTGGPGALLIGYLLIGSMMCCTVQSLGELAILYPVNGAFYEYAVRFIDPAWGFAMGWEYAIGWMITLPYELTAASVTISFWRDDLSAGIWIAVFLFALIVVQAFGVRGYGEVEMVLAAVKIVACLGFIVLGIVIDCGGVPTDSRGYIGGRYWHDPGAFRNGFKGFCSVFVTAAFAFGGTELVGLSAAEAANPARTLPKATRQIFWRIFFFYILNILLVGLIVPSDSDVLLGASGGNTAASPFVLAIRLAGIKILPSVFNAVITVSVLSVANSCTYGATRVLQALAQSGRAPAFFATIDKKGRPIWCIVLQICFGFLAFINLGASGPVVLGWFLAVTSLSGQFAYASACLAHIRFRRAWAMQGRRTEDIPWRSAFGVYGSYWALFIICISVLATLYLGIAPIGGSITVSSFFTNWLALLMTAFLFIFWKCYTREWRVGVHLAHVDLDLGRRYEDEDELANEKRNKSGWRKVVEMVF